MTQRGRLTSVEGRGHPLRRRHGGSRSTGLADEALVDRARGGDQRAVDELLQRYRGFARARVRNYFLVGGDREDVLQEALIGLFKAIRDFEPGSGTSFRSFAELCITRQVLSAIRTATRHKHGPLNTAVSLDRPCAAGSPRTVAELLPGDADDDPLAVLVALDDHRRLRTVLADALSGLEAEVLALYLDGCSYEEIASQVGRHAKAVDNALQRVKRKLEDRVAA